jgi:hypothetical protein
VVLGAAVVVGLVLALLVALAAVLEQIVLRLAALGLLGRALEAELR